MATLPAEYRVTALSEADFFKAAEAGDVNTDREQKCEAYFYAGSRRLIEGDRKTAREYFQQCLGTGVTSFTEYQSAGVELKALPRSVDD